MINFALDSSGKAAGVAVIADDKLVYESYLDAGLTHSETLLGLVNDAFAVTGYTPKQIDLYSVALGPGSFTGLRIGLALLKGLCLPFGTMCAGVSTLEALAENSVISGTVLAAMDARRGEIYYALFEKSENGLKRLTPDTADKAETAVQIAQSYKKPLIIIGDGAKMCYNILGNSPECILYPEHQRLGRAGAVARVGMRMHLSHKSVFSDELIPVYHRFSQAERQRSEKLGLTNQTTDKE